MVPPSESQALKAILVICIVSPTLHLAIVQYIIAQTAVEMLISCEHLSFKHFKPVFALRMLMLFMMFEYVIAPNPNIQEGVTDLPQVKIWDVPRP